MWNVKFAGVGLCGSESEAYITIGINGVRFNLHRVIWKMMTGDDPYPCVDHENTNIRDNTWDNLRLASKSQNGMNARLGKNNTTGFKGMSKVWNGSFMAAITINRKAVYLGLFQTPQEAHAAYCKAAQELHGEFWNPG